MKKFGSFQVFLLSSGRKLAGSFCTLSLVPMVKKTLPFAAGILVGLWLAQPTREATATGPSRDGGDTSGTKAAPQDASPQQREPTYEKPYCDSTGCYAFATESPEFWYWAHYYLDARYFCAQYQDAVVVRTIPEAPTRCLAWDRTPPPWSLVCGKGEYASCDWQKGPK